MHILLPPAGKRVGDIFWQPAADVYRMPVGWLVKFELAGVRREDIDVTVQGRVLTVRGRRRDRCSVQEGCHCYTMEIAYDRFERSLELPCDLGSAAVDAEYRDGMLLVHIRTEEVAP
jgi:HSP20 family protein